MKNQNEITVKVNGYEVPAHQNGSSLIVNAKDLTKVARKVLKEMNLKAKCTTESTGSINVELPFGTSKEVRDLVDQKLSFLEGESFDGMQDLAENIERKSDDGQRILFMSSYVFVKIDWQAPKVGA